MIRLSKFPKPTKSFCSVSAQASCYGFTYNKAMHKLNTILKALMMEMNLTESELARRTGIGQPVVHRIASGETDNPKVATLRPLANFFALSISQLIGDEPLPPNRLPGSFNASAHSLAYLPLLTWEQALEWPNLVTRSPTTTMVATDQAVSAQAYALVVKDNTMEPHFPEGTLLIVDFALQPENRDYAIVHLDGQKLPTFKQVLIDGSSVYLKPLNPDFKALPIDKNHRFLGVVIQTRLNLRSKSEKMGT